MSTTFYSWNVNGLRAAQRHGFEDWLAKVQPDILGLQETKAHPEQLSDSLQRIAVLPGDTQVYCAHEYTLANLGFAQWVEPANPDLIRRIKHEQEKRDAGAATVPSRLSDELLTNPFLRTDQQTVVQAAEDAAGRSLSTPREVFTALRQWKDKKYD